MNKSILTSLLVSIFCSHIAFAVAEAPYTVKLNIESKAELKKEILKKEKTTQLIDSYSELKEILLNRS